MGIKLSRAISYKYKHRNTKDLLRLLKIHKDKNILIITDGVFSMDGSLAPLDIIVKLAKKYNATIMVDDAHGTGIFGKTGRGTPEHFGVEKEIQIKMGTLSKALGGLGGFIASDNKVIELLKMTSSGYYFTSGLPASEAAGLIKAFEIIENEPDIRRKLWQNIYDMTKIMKLLGINIPDRFSCIIPIMIGDEIKCTKAEKIFEQEGIICSSVRFPAVSHSKSILRVTINSGHTTDHIIALTAGLKRIISELKLPISPMSNSEWSAFSKKYLPKYIKINK